MERLQQPTDTSCWATCVAMLTGIDIDLLPLDGDLAPSFALQQGIIDILLRRDAKWGLVLDDDYYKWVDLLWDNGYKVERHKTFPQKPCIVPVVIYAPDEIVGHVVVADEQGYLLDPSYSAVLSDLKYDKVDATFCNVRLTPSIFITIEPVTIS